MATHPLMPGPIIWPPMPAERRPIPTIYGVKFCAFVPQPDGTYTIPDGNLFPKGPNRRTAATRPEIYTMGLRNPYRIAAQSKIIGFVLG